MKKHSLELLSFLLTVFVGGFLGAYAILRCNTFASSQTMNLIMLVFALLGRSLGEFLVRIVIVLFYALGIIVGVLIPKYTKFNLKYTSLLVTSLSALLLGILPEYKNEFILIPIFFSMALQWNAFDGACGFSSANIFLTNNFRQTVVGVTNFLCTKDSKHLKQFAFYFSVIISYLLGCGISFLLVNIGGFRTILFLLIPLFSVFLCLKKESFKTNI